MISLYSTWWVKPDKTQELITPLNRLAAEVEKNEKGTLMYLINYPRFDFPTVKPGKNPIISNPMVRPGTVVFFEKYENWEAFETHLYGPYFTSFVDEYKSYFVAGFDDNPFVEVVFLDEQIGFRR
ncbi:putative quinol monooxygenase [Algoriphagus marinus]|uniref:putative quinol monooxygenase n=1 Tax=Algoriphagus marinus TaxID=1925762 RepID=UPI00094B7BB5|nr:hypothetical protein [Algoriphagus marinus]